MKKIKHVKLRNTGILFELLVRQITSDTLNNINESPAADIIRKFFSKKTELSKELELYQSIVKEHFNNEEKTKEFIRLIIETRHSLTNAVLNKQKYNLIKEIKKHFVLEDFFKARVSNYKVMASIYNLFEYDMHDNPGVLTNCKYTLVEHVLRKPAGGKKVSKINEAYEKEDSSVRMLAYKLLVEKFNKKYKNLDGNQRRLLEKYITNVSNTTTLKEYISAESMLLQKELKTISKTIKSDVVRIKLNEVSGLLTNLHKGKVSNDQDVLTLLKYYELVKELKQIGDK